METMNTFNSVAVFFSKRRAAGDPRRMIGIDRDWSRDTSGSGMFRPPPCHSVLLRSFASSRPVFGHGRRSYGQFKVDKTVEDINKLSSHEQLERLTQLSASADNNPDVDLWSLNADLLGRWPDIIMYRCSELNP